LSVMLRNIYTVVIVTTLFGVVWTDSAFSQTAVWEQKYEIFETTCEPNGSGPRITEFAIGPDGELYFSDPGHLFRSTDGGSTWEIAPFNVVHVEGIIPLSASRLLVGLYGGDGGIYRLSDHGDAWSRTNVTENISGLVANDDRSLIFAIAADVGLYVSSDEGETWVLTEEDRDVSAIRIGPNGRIFMLAEDVFVSDDGMAWTKFTGSKYPFPTKNANILLASENDGVYRSIDDGQSWTLTLSFDRPALLRNSEDVIIAISREGEVRLSDDDGESWISMISSSPLPCGVRSRASVDVDDHLWLGSDVGAIFRSSQTTHVVSESVAEVPEAIAFEIYPNPANSVVNIVLNQDSPGFSRMRVYDAIGRHVRSFTSEPLGIGEARFSWNTEKMPAGVYVLRLETDEGVKNQLLIISH